MNEVCVSVIIPVYNAEAYLDRCVQSVVSCIGSDGGVEILLVDDGSTDCSREICARYEAQYPYIHLYREDHAGVSHSRNIGIENARGKYLMFVDADDYLLNHCVGRLYEFAEREKLDLAFSDIRKVDFDGGIIERVWAEKDTVWNRNGVQGLFKAYLKEPRKYNLISFVWNKLFSRELVERFHVRFEESLPMNEDALFVFSYLTHASRIGYLHETTYCYCTDQENIGTGRMAEYPLAFKASLDVIAEYLERECGDQDIRRLYGQAFAELGLRNLFHIVRCNSNENAALYSGVRQIVCCPEMQEGIRVYSSRQTENLRIIPVFIRMKWTDMVVWAFRFQMIVRKK